MKTTSFQPKTLLAAIAAASLFANGCASPNSHEASASSAGADSHSVAASTAAHPTAVMPAGEALARLLEGNQRFVEGKAIHPNQQPERRAEVAKGQSPFAIVLTCADSRVSPELYFDQGLGDLFVIRNAGNVVDDHVLGSMEYAVEHLHAGLVVVVGHAQCGAVAAALAGGHAPGHIQSLVDSIAPAAARAKAEAGGSLDSAVRFNALSVAESLRKTGPILAKAVGDGTLRVEAARYDLDSGRVEILK